MPGSKFDSLHLFRAILTLNNHSST